MIYYRVAFSVGQAPLVDIQLENQPERVQTEPAIITWKWRSTLLTSPHALFTLLRAYSYVPKDQIRVFFASSESDMDEMLVRQNAGRMSSSVTAEQFMSGTRMNTLDIRRLELEVGSDVGDHDEPYVFSMPEMMKERMAWVKMLQKRREACAESVESSEHVEDVESVESLS